MIRIIAGISRSIPLIILLAIAAVVLYFAIAHKKSPAHAKEILIKVFTIVCTIITAAFLLLALYALADGNNTIMELALACAGVGLLGLIITLICKHFFKKNNPHYQWEPTEQAKPVTNKPDMLSIITKLLNLINDSRRK